jgi:hypothetical protein
MRFNTALRPLIADNLFAANDLKNLLCEGVGTIPLADVAHHCHGDLALWGEKQFGGGTGIATSMHEQLFTGG